MNIDEIPKEILDGLRRVEESKRAVQDSRGANPPCMNKLGTMFCQRCGRNMRKNRHRHCKAVPRSQRWSAICENSAVCG